MSKLNLFDALKIIEDGRASEILDQLQELHRQSSEDLKINYILAHALDTCEQHNQAKSVWETARSFQPGKQNIEQVDLPDEVNIFTHTDSLQIGLNKILDGDKTDEIQQLILQLDSADRTTFDEALLTGNASLDEVQEDSQDDPVTETFARILVAQKKYSEASSVYRSLSEQNPAERERLLHEAEKLKVLANQEIDS